MIRAVVAILLTASLIACAEVQPLQRISVFYMPSHEGDMFSPCDSDGNDSFWIDSNSDQLEKARKIALRQSPPSLYIEAMARLEKNPPGEHFAFASGLYVVTDLQKSYVMKYPGHCHHG